MTTQSWVNLNGTLVPFDQATLSVSDRSVLFGDGVYEVIAAYQGQYRALDQHLDRLQKSLKAILLESPLTTSEWKQAIQATLEKNNLSQSDAVIYLQVTRGNSVPRDFNFAEDAKASYFIQTRAYDFPTYDRLNQGYKAISHEDIRRAHCYIKSTCLQTSALLKHQAVEAGAEECLLHRNELLTEGSSSNVFMIKDSIVYTPPLTKSILPGVTRALVIDSCQQLDFAVKQIAIPFEQLFTADECWITSTTRTIKPITQLDDIIIGKGQPGDIWQQVMKHYLEKMHE